MTRCKECFTRLFYPFVLIEEDGLLPRSDMFSSRESGQDPVLEALERPMELRERKGPEPVWEEVQHNQKQHLGRRLARHMADYIVGNGYPIPPVRIFRWRDGLRQSLLRNLTIETGQQGKDHYEFEVSEIMMFLFDTGVGLLVLEFTPNTRGPDFCLENLVGFNYRIRTIEHGAPTLTKKRRDVPKDNVGASDPSVNINVLEGEFRLVDLIDLSLSGLKSVYPMQEMGTGLLAGMTYARLCPTEKGALTYSDISVPLFQLRRFYGPNYRPSSMALAESGNPEVYVPFERICHGVSLEGMATVCLDDGKTTFFNEMEDRVKTSYFVVFVLAMHQRVALEFFSACSSRFDRIVLENEDPSCERLIKRVCRLRSAAFHFTIHHTFQWVGAFTMYQEIYERLLSAMKVRELHDDVREDIREMDELLHRVDRNQREQKERAQEQHRKKLETAIAVLFPLTLLFSFWGSNFTEVSNDGALSWLDRPAVISYIVTALATLGLLLLLRPKGFGKIYRWLRKLFGQENGVTKNLHSMA